MKNLSPELQEKVKKYSLMVAWWHIHEKEKNIQKKLEEVLDKIGDTETELRLSGIKEDVFTGVLERAKKFVNLPIKEMTDRQIETMCKLIFGQKSTLTPFNKRDKLRHDILFFNPIKYAEWIRNRKKEEIKYVTYEHKKELWMGTKISIRSYVVEQAIKNGMGIRVKHGEQIMSLTPTQLKEEGFHNKESSHIAKMSAKGIIAGESYYLIDYIFKPDEA